MDTSPTSSRYAFITLMCVTALTYSVLYSPQPLLSTIQGSYPEHGDATIALLMTVAMLPLSVAPLVYGAFLGRWDTRRVLLACIACMALGGLGMYMSTSFGALLFFRVIQGLAIPAALTCVMAKISAMFQGASLQRALSIFIGVSIIGALIGRTCSGVVATFWSWRMMLICVSSLLLLLIVPLYRLPVQGGGAFGHVRVGQFAALLRTPGLRRVLYVDAMGLFVFAALANYLPFHLAGGQPGGGMPEWRIALMYLGYGVGIFVAFGSRRTIDFLGGEVRAIRLGIATYAVSMCLFLSSNSAVLFVGMSAICVGMFMSHSINPGLVNRLVPPTADRGAVNGLYLSLYYMGGALGSYVPGFIFVQWGWEVFICTLIACLLTTGVALWGLGRYIPK